MELNLVIVTLGTIRPDDSGVAFEQKTLDVSGRLGMPESKSPWHAQNPLLGEWRKTLPKPIMSYHPTLTSSSVQQSYHQWTALFLSYYIVT